jgi:hypothetical protein
LPLAAANADVSEPAVSGRPPRVKVMQRRNTMIVLGLILLVLGWLLGISILWTIGLIVLIIGIVFLVLGQTGRAVGGRKYWY